MPSQFFGLNIAYTGLLASNAALNTTSNNIANVHTEGYSRQQVSQQACNALRVFEAYGCAGAGVETLAIERVRDEFYDGKFWENNTRLGEYNMKQYYAHQIETYFDDTGENAGFKTIFDEMMIKGMQELLKAPSSVNAKAQFIGCAGDLTEYFNGLAGNLETMQKDVNQEIKLKVDQINSLAGEIATLNKQINTIELAGIRANELRDRRTILIDELSEIVDVQIKEVPITDPYHPERETGGNRFLVKIAGGQLLVDTNEYRGLECVARRNYEKVNQTDIDGLYDVYWEDGQRFNLNNAAMGGNLRGLAEMRDGNNGENFHGTVTSVGETTDADGFLHDTVTVQVGREYLQDLNKCNLSDQGGIINLGNQEFYYDSWAYTCSYDENGNEVYSYTFTLSKAGSGEKNPRRVTTDRMNKPANIGSSISYQGIPYYMNQMNEWIRTFSQKFNDILKSGYTAENREGVIMFTGNEIVSDEQFDFPDGTNGTVDTRYDLFVQQQNEKVLAYKDYQAKLTTRANELKAQAEEAGTPITDADALTQAKDALTAEGVTEVTAASMVGSITVAVGDDSYYRLTARNFSILSAMEQDANLMANKFKTGDGVEQDDLLHALRNMVTDKKKMSFRGASASEFLQCMLSDVALNASSANKFQQNFSDLANTIDNQRISISGVDEDEEAINLVKYQNGYNLASKMIQTLTEIYDRLILQTGV